MIKLNQVVTKGKEIPWNFIDEEAVLLNLDSGHYYILNDTGRRVWELLDGEHTVEEIVECIFEEYEVEREKASQDVFRLLEELEGELLIEVLSEAA